MYVRPISERLFSGMLMPAMRAMALALPLLVAGVRADHQDRAVATDDLALLAHRLDRRSDLHCFLSKTPEEGTRAHEMPGASATGQSSTGTAGAIRQPRHPAGGARASGSAGPRRSRRS